MLELKLVFESNTGERNTPNALSFLYFQDIQSHCRVMRILHLKLVFSAVEFYIFQPPCMYRVR